MWFGDAGALQRLRFANRCELGLFLPALRGKIGGLRAFEDERALLSGGLFAGAPGLLRLRSFVLFGFELRDQFLVGRAHDDRVEL